MIQKSKICVLGSANVDLIFRSPRFPSPGETIMGTSFSQCMGGKGANQAVAAARLGADVTFVACVGNDSLGQSAVEYYKTECIDTSFIRKVDSQPTGTAAIIVDDQAENCIVVLPGANASLNIEDVRRAIPAIHRADIIVSQLETPIESTLEAFRVAHAAGKPTVLTPAPATELPVELLRCCSVCIPNRTEIERLTDCKVESIDDAKKAMNRLLGRGVEKVVLTMGRDGACVADQNSFSHIPAYPVVAVDTTGAGDAFSGALAVYLSEGLSICDAVRQASLVAAIAVTRTGTQSSFPYRKEVDRVDL